ncbi:MAG: HAMP domain-containing sensor histidine kinase [Acetobacteraceae bacterium]
MKSGVGGHRARPDLRKFSSPLMRRILLLNTLPLALLAVTLLFLKDFQNSLLETEVNALREQAHIYAAALGQSAVTRRSGRNFVTSDYVLDAALARPLLLRLTEPSPLVEARLYGPAGRVVATSRGAFICVRRGNHTGCHIEFLPDSDAASPVVRDLDSPLMPQHLMMRLYSWLFSLLPLSSRHGIVTLENADHPSRPARVPGKYGDDAPPYIRRTAGHKLIITVAEPVIHEGQTIGILQLTRGAPEVDRSVLAVRPSIFSLFLVAMGVTVFLSWYLSLTIARPLLRLAVAANDLEKGPGRIDDIAEDLLARRGEIGILARALRRNIIGLWARMDATERFAADVSHELKNPLSSIRSAIETLPRVTSDTQQKRLLSIIESDVQRLDRLITDIAVASRIDAEPSRMRAAATDVAHILTTLRDMHQTTRRPGDPEIIVQVIGSTTLFAWAIEDRPVQVLRNIINNTLSFSPENGKIILKGEKSGNKIRITISDEGPGIPPLRMEEIFDRFYSERPKSESFGQHSGLGLSISRQIIEASNGQIYAENRLKEDGGIIGARFVIILPGAPSPSHLAGVKDPV